MSARIRRLAIYCICFPLCLRLSALGQDSVAFTSSNLPIIVIETHGDTIPDDPKITADMGIIDNGPGQRNAITDSFNVYNGKIGIEIRGFTSQDYPKKQYAVETRDTLGNNLTVSLLGLPAENDWVLSAGYDDKSLMRNALAYHLSNEMGRYASRSRFCELVLNGEYMGVYALFEKVKRDKGRVNITKMKTTDISGDNLTGGYIVKVDRLNSPDEEWWTSPYPALPELGLTIHYAFVYPKPEDLAAEQKVYIQSFVTAFETAMLDSNYADTTNGYVRYLDRSSAVDYFLINEMARNVDAYRASFYMYKDRDSKGGKLVLGPVWDFNAAFGNVDYYESGDTVGWNLIEMPDKVSDITEAQIPFWWGRLAGDSTFWYQAGNRWAALRKTQFTNQAISHFIDSVASYLDEAQQRNFQRWPILGEYVWPNNYVGATYEDEVRFLKDWLTERLLWMDGTLPPPFTPPPDDTLRVTMTSFTGVFADSIVTLNWLTSKEANTVSCEIQRRLADTLAPDTAWHTIGSLPAADTSTSIRSYTFCDTLQMSADLFYRITIDGKNGQSVCSSPLRIHAVLPRDILRVDVTTFTAQVDHDVVALNWQTAFEANTTQFEIERRLIDSVAHDSSWHVIGKIHAAETSSVSHSYAFSDTLRGIAQAAYRLRIDGKSEQCTYSDEAIVRLVDVTESVPLIPEAYALRQNYPNPFNPTTVISCQLPVVSRVRLVVYDLLGREVAVLMDELRMPGTYQVEFDGAGLSSGVYVLRMTAGSFIQCRKMVLAK